MKKSLSIFKLETIKTNLINISKEFPVGVSLIAILSIIFFSLVHNDFSNQIEDTLIRVNFSIIITFFLSIGVSIYSKANDLSCKKSSIFQILTLIFGFLFYLGFNTDIDNFENFTFFILTLIGIISFIFFAPYLKKSSLTKLKNEVFYSYLSSITVVFLSAFVVGGILSILGIIGIVSVFELFDLSSINESKFIQDWIIISAVITAPLFALANLPKEKTYNKSNLSENIFGYFLIKYITTPSIYVYFLILYTYTIKVLLNFGDWPKGEVSWMVIGFSIFGYFVYLFSYIFEAKNKFISTFRKIFPFVVIPQVFMLFYAIYLRINQYDITINRYFVVIFGIYLLVISLYYIFSKYKKLQVTVSLLTLFTIIISVGPWSVYNLPETRQYDRLVSNLEKANILQNNEIVPLNDYNNIDVNLSQNIYSGIDYVCEFDNCKAIKELFTEEYKKFEQEDKLEWEKMNAENIKKMEETLEKYDTTKDSEKAIENTKNYLERIKNEKYEGPTKWEIINHITEYIKVEQNYGSFDYRNSTLRLNIKNDSIYPIDTKGYSNIYMLNSYKNTYNETYAYINIDERYIEINDNGKIKTIDISNIITKLEEIYSSSKNSYSKEDLTFKIDGYKIIFEGITIKNPDYDLNKNINTYANGFILTK